MSVFRWEVTSKRAIRGVALTGLTACVLLGGWSAAAPAPASGADVTSSATWPGMQPQLAAVGTDVYVASAEGSTVQVKRSTDGGLTFVDRSPIAVPGKLSLGLRRGPRIAVTRQAVLVAGVAGAGGGGADGDLVLFRSTDQGASWGAPLVINDVPGAAREGLHGMAANADGLVVLTWLDLREKGTRIYAAVSRDHGASWAEDTLVYASPSGTVCQCCHPSVDVAADGRVAVMFRNSLDGNRDMYVARSRGGEAFAPATKLGSGSWKLEGCPMDGGAVVLTSKEDGSDNVVTTWRREDAVYLSSGDDHEVRIGTGRDSVIALAAAHRDLAWSNDAKQIVLQRGEGTPLTLGPGRFPSILAFPQHTLVAWEDQGTVQVRAVAR